MYIATPILFFSYIYLIDLYRFGSIRNNTKATLTFILQFEFLDFGLFQIEIQVSTERIKEIKWYGYDIEYINKKKTNLVIFFYHFQEVK